MERRLRGARRFAGTCDDRRDDAAPRPPPRPWRAACTSFQWGGSACVMTHQVGPRCDKVGELSALCVARFKTAPVAEGASPIFFFLR